MHAHTHTHTHARTHANTQQPKHGGFFPRIRTYPHGWQTSSREAERQAKQTDLTGYSQTEAKGSDGPRHPVGTRGNRGSPTHLRVQEQPEEGMKEQPLRMPSTLCRQPLRGIKAAEDQVCQLTRRGVGATFQMGERDQLMLPAGQFNPKSRTKPLLGRSMKISCLLKKYSLVVRPEVDGDIHRARWQEF